GAGISHIVWTRNKISLCRKRSESVSFVEQEKEGSVLKDGNAKGEAKLHVSQGRGLARSRIGAPAGLVEVVRGISESGVANPAGISMKGVGTALHHHVDGSATLYPKLGRRRFLDANFFDRFGREDDCRNTGDARLAERLVAVVAIIVVQAIEQIVVGSGTGTVNADGQKAAARGALNSGG